LNKPAFHAPAHALTANMYQRLLPVLSIILPIANMKHFATLMINAFQKPKVISADTLMKIAN
jgi:hypothetical protein